MGKATRRMLVGGDGHYTVRQVIRITGLKPHRLRYMVKRGIAPHLKMGGTILFTDPMVACIQELAFDRENDETRETRKEA